MIDGALLAREATSPVMDPNDDLRACRKCGGSDTVLDTSTHSLVLCICCRTCGYAGVLGGADPEGFSELANAVQTAVLVSEALQADGTTERAHEIRMLRAALKRITLALRQLRVS
jgi:hypothetical protein